MSGSQDPYKILGLTHGASLEEIRQAYRRAATKYHPDAGGDAWAFQEVQQAYNELRSRHEKAQARRHNPAASPANQSPSVATAVESNRNTSARSAGRAKANEPPQSADRLDSNDTGEPTIYDWLFGKPLKLHNETTYFIFANFMDLVMTGILLRYSAVEANPIANYFYLRYGFVGMVGLKIAIVALVCIVAQSIASRSELKARILLIGGTLLVAAVVVYSMFLARHQLSN